jgi:hypothetical protein
MFPNPETSHWKTTSALARSPVPSKPPVTIPQTLNPKPYLGAGEVPSPIKAARIPQTLNPKPYLGAGEVPSPIKAARIPQTLNPKPYLGAGEVPSPIKAARHDDLSSRLIHRHSVVPASLQHRRNLHPL